jgi:hypothetical protein
VVIVAGYEPSLLGPRAHHSESTTHKLYESVQRASLAVFASTRKYRKHPGFETSSSKQDNASTSAKVATRAIWCSLPRWLAQLPLWLERWVHIYQFDGLNWAYALYTHVKVEKISKVNVNPQELDIWGVLWVFLYTFWGSFSLFFSLNLSEAYDFLIIHLSSFFLS